MKYTKLAIPAVVVLAAVIWLAQRDDEQEVATPPAAAKPMPAPVPVIDGPQLPSSEELLEKGLVEKSGDDHSMAIDFLVECINLRLVLTPEDRDALIGFISKPKPVAIGAGQWQERINEILNLLRVQPGEVPGLADVLIQLSSEDPDPVVRMYALQHVALWISKEPVEENKEDLVALLEAFAADTDNPLTGSAVLFLNDLDQSRDLPGRIDTTEVIEEAALRLVANQTAEPAVRICALHTSAERKLAAVIPDTRAIAKDASLMIPLRKAAIYTIGELGTTDDLALLESLSESDRVLEAATKPAIKRIQAREKQL